MEISRKTSNYIRGICALTVLLSHIISYSGFGDGNKYVSLISGMMGYIPVAIFFFLSGYGLMKSYENKGIDYAKHLPSHRMLPYYVKYLIVAAIYMVFGIVNSETIRFTAIVRTLTYGGTVVKFGWYLQTQLVLYIFFHVSFTCAMDKKTAVSIVTALMTIFWIICAVCKLDTTWYMTTPSFLFGIMWPVVSKRLTSDKFLTRERLSQSWGGIRYSCISQYFCLRCHLMSQLMTI